MLRSAARRYGFLDPIGFMARLRQFAEPSEVQEPIELLRAGIAFHARGLINTRTIQHNLDWVWPFWVERQFNPEDPGFIPRAFSFSHVNLTHRNWTAVGLPDLALYPIVDPGGLVTPLHDGWSIDWWFQAEDGSTLFPSKLPAIHQVLTDGTNRIVTSRATRGGVTIESRVSLELLAGRPHLSLRATLEGGGGGRLIAALRPYNPEGVQFIETIAVLGGRAGWLVNNEVEVRMAPAPAGMVFSTYKKGDVSAHLDRAAEADGVACPIGMATAAAFFDGAAASEGREIRLTIPLPPEETVTRPAGGAAAGWEEVMADTPRLRVPDEHFVFLYDTAARTLVHLSADEPVPGPYTYRRFWFRDACFMIHALLALGLTERCHRLLAGFFAHQTVMGYFHSQDGEWDSNGQVLWIMQRYRLMADRDLDPDWLRGIYKGARWIEKKRTTASRDPKYAGLLPPGFSAEHFGPNDYYYWDDFWAVAGLQAAADLLAGHPPANHAHSAREWGRDLEQSLLASLAAVEGERHHAAVPVSPNRRLDSGAIGSLVADYPLQFFEPGDRRMVATAEYLLANCMQQGCFFQDMIHSGINAYMTLSLAQVLLRAGDPRFADLVRGVAAHASPTGQWPEAIHPATGGGCMGDGQHGWAAAEWVLMIRNLFVREEKDGLVLGAGLFPEWLRADEEISFGPALTLHGVVTVRLRGEGGQCRMTIEPRWHRGEGPEIDIRVPGFRPRRLARVAAPAHEFILEPLP